MVVPLHQKSTIDEIRARFDQDVERFSQLATGQSATVDAPLAMELISQAAIRSTSPIQRVLDIGCGAGNNVLKLRQLLGLDFTVDLLDLSGPMLARAAQRVADHSDCPVNIFTGDFRTVELSANTYDVVIAAAVLHHLRDDTDWKNAFQKIFHILAPGGSVWVTDLVAHETTAVQELMWQRYGDYLSGLGGDEYREQVFAYVDKEDSPRPVTWQLQLFRTVGFAQVELLHKNGCFAAFGAIKGA